MKNNLVRIFSLALFMVIGLFAVSAEAAGTLCPQHNSTNNQGTYLGSGIVNRTEGPVQAFVCFDPAKDAYGVELFREDNGLFIAGTRDSPGLYDYRIDGAFFANGRVFAVGARAQASNGVFSPRVWVSNSTSDSLTQVGGSNIAFQSGACPNGTPATQYREGIINRGDAAQPMDVNICFNPAAVNAQKLKIFRDDTGAQIVTATDTHDQYTIRIDRMFFHEGNAYVVGARRTVGQNDGNFLSKVWATNNPKATQFSHPRYTVYQPLY